MDGVKAARAAFSFFKAHPRAIVVVQLVVLAVFFGSVGFAMRGSFVDAGSDLRNADPVLFVLACFVLAAYYLVFVLGWMRILWDWGMEISYPAALRAEMVSMLAKYIPGGVWTPAARVVAGRRAGGRRDGGRAGGVRAVGPRAARGLDVRPDARDRVPGRRPQRDAAESRRDHGRRGAALCARRARSPENGGRVGAGRAARRG